MIDFNKNKKQIAILLDPDKQNYLDEILQSANNYNIDYIFVGGSIISSDINLFVEKIKQKTNIPIVIFPGNPIQFSPKADAILFLSLLSGRNPEYLISNQIISAPIIKKSKTQSISTAYILVDGGKTSSVEYISNTKPIPADKADIVLATVMAAEMIGFKTIYLEAGSGAKYHVSERVIEKVKRNTNLPLIVGGGIKNIESAKKIFLSGADVIVVGSKIEEQPNFIKNIAEIKNKINESK